jgi:Fe-S-cluster-containing dehydrogenase component
LLFVAKLYGLFSAFNFINGSNGQRTTDNGQNIMEETMFIDPQRCIGCRSCVAACRECATHKGHSMIYVDYLDRSLTTATMPTICMHCVEPTCAQVCPADAIKITEEGVVLSALKPRCLDCRNCVNACPFGVPKYSTEMHLQMKCDMCFDRSSEGLKPMCASVCPTGALTFGRYEEVVPKRKTKPVNVHIFGNQKVETKVYLMLPTDDKKVLIDGCGVFEGRLENAGTAFESWIDTQVEKSDKSNEF